MPSNRLLGAGRRRTEEALDEPEDDEPLKLLLALTYALLMLASEGRRERATPRPTDVV